MKWIYFFLSVENFYFDKVQIKRSTISYKCSVSEVCASNSASFTKNRIEIGSAVAEKSAKNMSLLTRKQESNLVVTITQKRDVVETSGFLQSVEIHYSKSWLVFGHVAMNSSWEISKKLQFSYKIYENHGMLQVSWKLWKFFITFF